MRVEIYRWFVDSGSAPDLTHLVEILGSDLSSVHEGLSELAQARQIVLGESFKILMAHPFSVIPLGFSVMGSATLWWGGCSWDSFALPSLIEATEPLVIATSCPSCERALAWKVSSAGPPEGIEGWLTSLCRQQTCGMTLFIPAGIKESSAHRVVLTSGY